MRNWDSCVSACKGLLFFFFRLWKKKPNNQFQTVVAKERKSEREREKERRSQTEKKVSRVSHNSLPLCFVSAVVLKSNKAL